VNVLVHVEVAAGVADPDALGVLSALRAGGVAPEAVVFGDGVEPALSALIAHGAAAVTVFDDPQLTGAAVDTRLAALSELCGTQPGGRWLAPTTTMTTELAARLAVRLEAGLVWGLTGFGFDDAELVAQRTCGNDTLIADLTWSSAWGIGLVRPHALDPVLGDHPVDVPVTRRALPSGITPGVAVTESVAESVSGPRLDAADVIVAAGRGIGERANLDLIVELADLLGGVAGVSLPLVELGWAPRAMQVGQTGTIVAPLLYVACGISGQIQHRVGMERSGTIVAINTDPAAPIMSFCDLAVVADVKSVVPRLIELLRANR
jgi:electron transfer flavoprotein alpha subunit